MVRSLQVVAPDLRGDFPSLASLTGYSLPAERDAFVLPTLPIPAPPLGATTVQVGSTEEPVRNAMLRLTQPFNVTGHPAISIP